MNILLIFSAFFSEIIGTIAGFGSSTVFLPLALVFLDFKTALVLVAFFHIFGNLGRIGFFKSGLDKGLVLKFGIPSVFFTMIGALLVSFLSQELLKGILGIFLVVFAIYSFWKENFVIKASAFAIMVGGGLSGFLAGLIGTGGALRGAFLTGFGLPKEKYITTAATVAIAVDLTRLPVYLSQGFLNKQYYLYIPVLLTIAIVGSFTGKKIIERFSSKLFRKVVLFAIFLTGVKFIFDFLI